MYFTSTVSVRQHKYVTGIIQGKCMYKSHLLTSVFMSIWSYWVSMLFIAQAGFMKSPVIELTNGYRDRERRRGIFIDAGRE